MATAPDHNKKEKYLDKKSFEEGASVSRIEMRSFTLGSDYLYPSPEEDKVGDASSNPNIPSDIDKQ